MKQTYHNAVFYYVHDDHGRFSVDFVDVPQSAEDPSMIPCQAFSIFIVYH